MSGAPQIEPEAEAKLRKRFRDVVLLLALLLTPMSGCGPSDECRPGPAHCDGHVVMICVAHEDNGKYYTWGKTDCGPAACVVDDQGAFCALDAAADPDCDASNATVCRGSTFTQCRAGYAEATYDCATSTSTGSPSLSLMMGGLCLTDSSGSFCVANPTRDPACPRGAPDGPIPACSGNDVVECHGGFAVKRTSCNDLTCACNGSGAACTLASCVAI